MTKQEFSLVFTSGDEGARTLNLRRARAALSQLSYVPLKRMLVGLPGLEPGTSPLSEARSNQLSYKPNMALTGEE